jgi:hypothetical protein
LAQFKLHVGFMQDPLRDRRDDVANKQDFRDYAATGFLTSG